MFFPAAFVVVSLRTIHLCLAFLLEHEADLTYLRLCLCCSGALEISGCLLGRLSKPLLAPSFI